MLSGRCLSIGPSSTGDKCACHVLNQTSLRLLNSCLHADCLFHSSRFLCLMLLAHTSMMLMRSVWHYSGEELGQAAQSVCQSHARALGQASPTPHALDMVCFQSHSSRCTLLSVLHESFMHCNIIRSRGRTCSSCMTFAADCTCTCLGLCGVV